MLLFLVLATPNGCGGDQASSSSQLSTGPAGAIAVNVLSGVLVSIFSTQLDDDGDPLITESGLKPTKIGSALPAGDDAQLTGGERLSKVIRTHYAGEVKLTYRIEYLYGVKFKEKGAYIKDVVFIPMEADISRGYSLKAVSLSQDPETSDQGKASLRFVVTFTTGTPDDGITVTSHRYLIRDHDGKLIAVTPELDHGDPRVQ